MLRNYFNVKTMVYLYYFQIIVSLIYVSMNFSWWGMLVAYLAFVLYGGLGVEINAHRYFSHGTFKYKYKWMEHVFSWFTCLSGTGSPVTWVAIHHEHHKHSDKEGDPHNPKEKGLKMFLSPEYKLGNPLSVKKMLNPYQAWLFRYYLLVPITTWVFLYIIGGMWLVVYAGMLGTVISTVVQIGTTYFCHLVGYRNYEIDDDSTNVWWWALIDLGDGLHNNHHANPGRWHLSDHWWEIDISGFLIGKFLADKATLK